MISLRKPIAVLFVLFASSLVGGMVSAQEPSAEQMTAARKALGATGATIGFDNILPQTSFKLKNELTANTPNRADEISSVVDEETISIATRRGDLELEAAKIFANTFSTEELDTISAFFTSDIGKKYLASTPIVIRELQKSARIWASGVQRDLVTNVQKRLSEPKN